jgi:hypothetical protein
MTPCLPTRFSPPHASAVAQRFLLFELQHPRRGYTPSSGSHPLRSPHCPVCAGDTPIFCDMHDCSHTLLDIT